jgi:hypothetical protein
LRELKSKLPRRVPLIGLLPCVRTDSLGAHYGEPRLDAVLEKPVRYSRLVKALEQVFLARAPPSVSPTYSYGERSSSSSTTIW